MLGIIFKDGECTIWEEGEYTEIKYDKKCLIILNDVEDVGYYNKVDIKSIIID